MPLPEPPDDPPLLVGPLAEGDPFEPDGWPGDVVVVVRSGAVVAPLEVVVVVGPVVAVEGAITGGIEGVEPNVGGAGTTGSGTVGAGDVVGLGGTTLTAAVVGGTVVL